MSGDGSQVSDYAKPDDVLPEDPKVEVNPAYQAELNRMMIEQSNLRAQVIENGEDAKKFLKSAFGKYLIGQSEIEAMRAKEELADVDPKDSLGIERLQFIIKRHYSFAGWVYDAISAGEAEYQDFISQINSEED